MHSGTNGAGSSATSRGLTAWRRALTSGGTTPARVLVVADSIGECSHGFESVWRTIHGSLTLGCFGAWGPPRRCDVTWSLLPGRPADMGLEARGQILRLGDGPAGEATAVVVATTLDLYYTARPDGAPIRITVDGVELGVLDTSLDELGSTVRLPLMSQRWRSPWIGSLVTWQMEVIGPGVAAIEAVCTPPAAGVEVHGTGRSGVPTGEQLDSGLPQGHLAAMAARGEPPDLVLWAADTAGIGDPEPQAGALGRAIELTRSLAPEASIAYYLPSGRIGRPDWPASADLLRSTAERHGAVVIDGLAALGDVSPGTATSHYAVDGVHLSPEGQSVLTSAMLEVLASGLPTGPEPLGRWSSALLEAEERAVRIVTVKGSLDDGSMALDELWEHLRSGAAVPARGSCGHARIGGVVDGVELHQFGSEGRTTREVFEAGGVIRRLRLMASRDEQPDLVVWSADPGSGADVREQVRAVADALDATRLAAPEASIALVLPRGDGRPHWDSLVPWFRQVAADRRVSVVDLRESREIGGSEPAAGSPAIGAS